MKIDERKSFFAKALEKTFIIYYNVGVNLSKNEFFAIKICKMQKKGPSK